MMPPRKFLPLAERPSSIELSAKTLVLPALSHTEMWAWQPLPVRPWNGFGMKVARRPCFSAIDLTMNLKKECLSAVAERIVEGPVHLELDRWHPRGRSGRRPSRSASMWSQISAMTS